MGILLGVAKVMTTGYKLERGDPEAWEWVQNEGPKTWRSLLGHRVGVWSEDGRKLRRM